MTGVRRCLRAVVASALVAVVLGIALRPGVAAAVIETKIQSPDPKLFPKPAFVRKQVRFWENVFYKYPSTTVIVHESGDPDRVIDVIDYKSFASKSEKPGPVPRKERDEVTQKYLKRYTKAVERFAKEQEKALRYGPIEKRVYRVYGKDPAALKKLYSGDIKIRAQTGLADDFRQAAATAQAYFPYMEKVFAQYGVPTRLTRLAFVESMFNLRAKSKVGASGIWQFMPETARHFIYVTPLVDERNSPYKATRAAAQFLLNNYRDLQSWPLAITAYNHGKVGMQNAVKQVGTNDFGKILKHYESPSFGFASKNFYAEFLAAASTYDRLYRQKKIGEVEAFPETESVILQKPVSVAQILKHTPLTKELLAEHNPCILEAAFTNHAEKPLPAFYELKVPRKVAPAAKAALLLIKETRYAKK